MDEVSARRGDSIPKQQARMAGCRALPRSWLHLPTPACTCYRRAPYSTKEREGALGEWRLWTVSERLTEPVQERCRTHRRSCSSSSERAGKEGTSGGTTH